jgi:hypothetical protein
MTSQFVRECDWCGKEFIPKDNLPFAVYNLINAGKSICLECSDLWEDEEIRLHIDKLYAYLDEGQGAILTASGHVLPLKLIGWSESPSWLGHGTKKVGEAIDKFGGKWVCVRGTDRLCTLKPKRGPIAWLARH